MRRPTYMWIFQLTHTVQTCIVQGSTGTWESIYGESRLKLFANFWLQEWSSSLTPTLFNGQLYLLRDVISSGLSVFFPKFGSFGLGPKILGGVDVVFLPSSSYFSYDHISSSRNKSEDNTQRVRKGASAFGTQSWYSSASSKSLWLLKRTLFAIWATYNKLYLSPGWQSISIYEILRRMGKTTTKQRNRTQPHLVLMLEKNIWPLPQWLTSEYMNNMSLSFPKHNKQQKNKFVDCLTEIFLSGYGWRCKYSCALKIVVLDMYQPQTQL